MAAFGLVLLVDDDNINNYINEKLIVKADFASRVVTRYNGQDALDYLQYECPKDGLYPDLILLDINMPVINGIEFIELFQKLKDPMLSGVRICVLSTSENIRDKQKIEELGHYFFVHKPLTRDKLNSIFGSQFKSAAAQA